MKLHLLQTQLHVVKHNNVYVFTEMQNPNGTRVIVLCLFKKTVTPLLAWPAHFRDNLKTTGVQEPIQQK